MAFDVSGIKIPYKGELITVPDESEPMELGTWYVKGDRIARLNVKQILLLMPENEHLIAFCPETKDRWASIKLKPDWKLPSKETLALEMLKGEDISIWENLYKNHDVGFVLRGLDPQTAEYFASVFPAYTGDN